MHERKAFTLIELLVVIAIIALLLAVIMPSLQKAKEMGRMVVCLSNHKNLVAAWKAYSSDNDGKLVNGHTLRGGNLEDGNDHWVEPPVRFSGGKSFYAGGDENTPTELEHELNGIRAGTLFPYLKNVDVYRCLSDRRSKLSPPIAIGSSFRTYSITAQMNGEGARDGDVRDYFYENTIGVTRESQITSSATRFVFIDDFDSRSYNMGSWIFGYRDDGTHVLGDPISVWHFKKCNFSYADGHAESYVWKDQRTHKASRYRALKEGTNVDPGNGLNNEDLRFLGEGYRAR